MVQDYKKDRKTNVNIYSSTNNVETKGSVYFFGFFDSKDQVSRVLWENTLFDLVRILQNL